MKDKRSINLLNPDHHEKPSLFPTYARGLSLISAVTLTTLYIVYSASGANTTIGNNISTSGTLTVGSTGRFSGAFYASSTLQASGEARFYNNAIVDGNVGIGTTTPSSTLSVQGNALFSGNISSVANITATGTLSLTGTSGTSTIASGQGFTVGDSQFIVQQGSGRVGIGTSSPTQLLTLGEETSRIGTDSADGSDNKRLQISGANASATRGAYISLHGNEYSTDPGDLGIFAGSNAVGKIIFHTGGTEQVRINSSGNVGIGTTSPAQTLAVQGNALFSGNLSVANVTATGSIAFINTSTSTVPNGVLNAWTLATSTSATPIISLNTNQSGNSISRVAINGNRADASLHVYGTGVSGNTNRLAQFQQTQNNTGATIIISGLDSNGNNNWWNFGPGPTTTAFIIGNSHDPNINERFRIDGSGNVGIGTTSPVAKLVVVGSNGIRVNDSSSSGSGRIDIGDNTLNNGSSYIRLIPSNSVKNWQIATNDTIAEAFEISPSTVAGGSTFTTPALKINGAGLTTLLNASTTQISSTGATYLATSGGNVGIGTTSPSVPLAVQGSGPTNVSINGNPSGNNYAQLSLLPSGTQNSFVYFGRDFHFQSYPSNSIPLTIKNSSGNVGIGTTTPNWKLQVNGTSASNAFFAISDATASTDLKHWTFSSQGGNFYVATSSDALATTSIPALMVTSDGRVGIGVTNPGASQGSAGHTGNNSLHVNGGILGVHSFALHGSETYASSSNAFIEGWAEYNSAGNRTAVGTINIMRTSTTDGTYDGEMAFLTRLSGSIQAEAMRINKNGNVGIGTTSPAQTLAVQGNALFSGNISSVANITATGTLNVTGLTALGNASTTQISSTGATYLATSGGNVGIGTTTPNWKLQVNGTRPFFTLSDDTASTDLKHWTLSSQGGNFYIATSSDALATSTVPALTILSNGNVGIGTSSPAARLSIEGTCVDTGAGCADYAELYPATEPVEPGDILMLDTENSGFVKKAQQSNVGGQMSNVALVGAVSTNPAIIIEGSGLQLMTGANYQSNPNKPAVALAGKIPVKVNLEGGEIQIGDPITISSQAGIGKKATESGKIIGYALDQFNEESEMEDGYGKIMVFANLGYYQAPSQTSDNEQLTSDTNNPSLIALALEAVKSWLADMQVTIENGIVRLKELVAETITANKAVLNKVQLKDEDTGETYCVRMKSGALFSTQGDCDAPPAEEPAEENSADNSSDQPASETGETEEGATEETATTETATNEQPPQDQNPPETTETSE